MQNSVRRQAALAAFILVLSSLGIACGGSNGGGTMSGGSPLRIQVSATGANSALSGVPADALTAQGSGGGLAALDRSGGSGRPMLQSLDVTFAAISARDDAGNLVPVTIALPTTVDLLGLRTGGTVELPAGFLPEGSYRGFVVTLSAVALVLDDGTRITIEPPSGGFTTEVATQPFSVVDGQATTVELNLRCDRALRWVGNHFQFFPVFDCNVHGRGDDGSGGDDDSGSGNDSQH